MQRYLNRLANKDLSLSNSMIPLGSCTMKLNSAAEMIPDYVARSSANCIRSRRLDQAQGYLQR